jgi:hypothetical protein
VNIVVFVVVDWMQWYIQQHLMHILYCLQLIEEIVPVNSWEEKIDHFVNTSPVLRKHADYYKALGASMVARVKAISSYKWNHKNNVKARTILVRCDVVPIKADDDYGLSKVGMFYQSKVHPLLL